MIGAVGSARSKTGGQRETSNHGNSCRFEVGAILQRHGVFNQINHVYERDLCIGEAEVIISATCSTVNLTCIRNLVGAATCALLHLGRERAPKRAEFNCISLGARTGYESSRSTCTIPVYRLSSPLVTVYTPRVHGMSPCDLVIKESGRLYYRQSADRMYGLGSWHVSVSSFLKVESF